jgi:phosphopantothenoylcysteine decarboxylase/phosphopantothenate--cysteine ligase
MDLDMYRHESTRENLALLEDHGVSIIDADSGDLASGLSGEGRLREPDEIVALLEAHFSAQLPLTGKKVLVTAGPTWESIDPVRYIGNRSSGKMGIAIAEALAERGAEVLLVCGPTSVATEHPLISRTDVESAQEMYLACSKRFKTVDVAILAAAVADYRPIEKAEHKIKKSNEQLEIKLEKTTDILASLGAEKQSHQVLIGFALETQNAVQNAIGKLERKNLDLIVLNSLEDEGAGFGHDTNKVTFIEPGNKLTEFELKSKTEVATDIAEKVTALSKS